MGTVHKTKEEIEAEMQIIIRAKSDPNRFAPLYDKYYKSIFVFVYRRTDDEDTASDLTSQVFMKAVINLNKYEFKGLPFSAWLFRIAVNEINMFFRNGKKKRTIHIDDYGLFRLKDEVYDYEQEDKETILLNCIQNLSADEVQFLELRFFEDKSFKEIGIILDITENNAKVKTYRILDKIKKIITSIED